MGYVNKAPSRALSDLEVLKKAYVLGGSSETEKHTVANT